jgi:DNA-binding PadR family transcriptional regulator
MGAKQAEGRFERRAQGRQPAPMQSAVQCALLGLVIERPSYGYELARRFEHTFGELLHLSAPSYIYTALDALRRRALIEEVPGVPAQRLPKPHYQATEKGRLAYRDHLLAQMLASERRRHLFFRQLAVLANEPETALEIIEIYERNYLDAAKVAPLRYRGSPDTPAAFAAELAAEDRRLGIDGTLAWLDQARRRLKSLAEHSLAPSEPQ